MARSLKDSVAAFAGGDTSAFDEIYSLTYRSVFVAAKLLMKNEQDAEDVAQEVYIQAYSSLWRLQSPDAAAGWFRTVTRNICLNRLRMKTETLLGEDEEYIMANQMQHDPSAMPEAAYITKERNAILMEMVEQLPFEQRETVLYYYMQNQSVSKVAELLQCSVGTVKSRLNYARTKLRAMADEKEKQGVKLYGFGALPLLGFFLRRSAGSLALDPTTAFNILANTHYTYAGTSTATGSGAAATGISAGAAQSAAAAAQTAATASTGIGAVISAAGTTLTAAVLTVAVLFSSIGIGAAVAIANRDTDQVRPGGSGGQTGGGGGGRIRNETTDPPDITPPVVTATDEPTTPVDEPIDEPVDEPQPLLTIDEWFEYFDGLISQEAEREDNEFIQRAISKADDFAARGEYEWAMYLVSNALTFHADNQLLLDKRAEILLTRTIPLFDLDWQRGASGSYLFQQHGGIDQFGVRFDTSNFYTLNSSGTTTGRRNHIVVSLDGRYNRLTGKQILIGYTAASGWGAGTMVFAIDGDGVTLFERSYTADRPVTLDGLDRDIAEIDLDISGINTLEIHYYRDTGQLTHGEVGLVDFVVHQSPDSGDVSYTESSGVISADDDNPDGAEPVAGTTAFGETNEMTSDELITLLEELLMAEAESGGDELLEQVLAKADALGSQGRVSLANALIDSVLSVYPGKLELLDKQEELSAKESTPLFDISWRRQTSGTSFRHLRDGGSDMFGNGYSTSNLYSASARSRSYALISLNGEFSRLTGTVMLMGYGNGRETVMFRIVGDGSTLFEQTYKNTGDRNSSREGLESTPVGVDIDITGVDVLQIQVYTMGDMVWNIGLVGGIATNYTIAYIGMADFTVHQ